MAAAAVVPHGAQAGQVGDAGQTLPDGPSRVVLQAVSSVASSVATATRSDRDWHLGMVWLECRVRQPAKYTDR